MKLLVEVASVPDRDTVVAEIWLQDKMLAEIRPNDLGKYIIELYPCPDGGIWEVDYEDMMQALSLAKKRLSS